MAGSTGVLPAPKGYLKRLREITQKHGILLIFDEVITGYGRLGYAFAAERYGVLPDMLTFAKGITNGAAPMGGVLVRDTIHDAFMSGPEHAVELTHGYTYSAHPLACAAALATLDIYRDEKLFERANKLEPKFADAVMSLKGEPNVLDIRTVGLTARHRPRAAPGPAGQARLRRAQQRLPRQRPDAARRRRHPGADAAADRQRGPDRRNRREGRQGDPRGRVAALSHLTLRDPLLAGTRDAFGSQGQCARSTASGTFETTSTFNHGSGDDVLPWRNRDMLAPSSGLLRAGLALKLNQIKRATRSYLRDRTNQATGTVTSYAIAAGLFAAAGVFLLAACLVGVIALFRWIEIKYGMFPAFGAVGALLLVIAAICAALAASTAQAPAAAFSHASPAACASPSSPIRSSPTRSRPRGTPPRRFCWHPPRRSRGRNRRRTGPRPTRDSRRCRPA